MPMAGRWSSPKWSSRRFYLQCLLRLDQIWRWESIEFALAKQQVFRAYVARQDRRANAGRSYDVGASVSLPALENLPEPAPQPLADVGGPALLR